jgi:pimeloyl-ACP methyl ester carboxylesterase
MPWLFQMLTANDRVRLNFYNHSAQNVKKPILKLGKSCTMKKITLYHFFYLLLLSGPTLAQGQSMSFGSHHTYSVDQVEANGFIFQVRAAGHYDRSRAVILLHGFPETHLMWQQTQERLASEGYFSIAPELRGYGSGNISQEVSDYDFAKLVEDIIAIADHYNLQGFHLVGHDVGGAVSQFVAYQHPTRLKSLTLLSIAHLQSLGEAIQNSIEQQQAVWYFDFFQQQQVPEAALLANDAERLRANWTHAPKSVQQSYVESFQVEGVLTGAINSYRANATAIKEGTTGLGPISVNTLFIHGVFDKALLPRSHQTNYLYFTGELTHIDLQAGHWLVHETFSAVLEPMLVHIKRH